MRYDGSEALTNLVLRRQKQQKEKKMEVTCDRIMLAKQKFATR